MAAHKRKTLPKDFVEQLTTKSVDELKALFDTTEVTAYKPVGNRGYGSCAIAYAECPDELTRWLVERGLDPDTTDADGFTPLVSRASKPGANLAILLDLGAKVDGPLGGNGRAPLAYAALSGNLDHVKLLLERGANPLGTIAINDPDNNALALSVRECDRYHIGRQLPVVEYLAALRKPAPPPRGWRRLLGRRSEPERTYPVTDTIRRYVTAHGQSLERYRFSLRQQGTAPGDDPKFPAFEAGVLRLYELFSVEPVPPIPVVERHAGLAPIVVTATDLTSQYVQLWNMLVPPSGPAITVQGEVVRIVGRVRHEIETNGGANWGPDFRAMQDALLGHLRLGTPVPADLYAEVARVVAATRDGAGWDSNLPALDQAAVTWVLANPVPIPLPTPAYPR